ncbi:MAG: CPBP family intramembrane metalloprotease [Candidatus Rhabdochlamydia sp.]
MKINDVFYETPSPIPFFKQISSLVNSKMSDLWIKTLTTLQYSYGQNGLPYPLIKSPLTASASIITPIFLAKKINKIAHFSSRHGGVIGDFIENKLPVPFIDKSSLIAKNVLRYPMEFTHQTFEKLWPKTTLDHLFRRMNLAINSSLLKNKIFITLISPVVEESITQGLHMLLYSSLIAPIDLLESRFEMGLSFKIMTMSINMVVILQTALIFASAHEATADTSNFVDVFIPGVVYATMFSSYGLLAAISTHSVYNLIGILVKERLEKTEN